MKFVVMYSLFNKLWYTKKKQEAQGLQAFTFCVVSANDEHLKHRVKRKFGG